MIELLMITNLVDYLCNRTKSLMINYDAWYHGIKRSKRLGISF